MSDARSDLARVRQALSTHDWQRALDLARAATVDDIADEAELADLLAEAAWWLGHIEDCIEARERAYRIFDEQGDHRRAGQCAVWLYEHHAISARPAVASGWLRRAHRALEGDRCCVEYGALTLREAESAHGSGDLGHARELAAAALQLGRTLPSVDLEAEALQTMGRVMIDSGEVADGMAHLDEAMLFAVEGRLRPYSTGKVYCSLVSACEDLGDLDRAAEWTAETLRWAEKHPFAIFPGICRVHRAVVLKRRGSLVEAEHEALRACDELIHSHVANSAAAYAEVGDIRRRLGALDSAEDAFARAQGLCGQPCGALALLRLAQGRVDTALEIIIDCLDTSPNQLARSTLLPTMIQVAVAAGEVATASAAFEELEGIARTFDTPLLRATVLSSHGRLRLAQDKPAQAHELLRSALEQWQLLDIPYEVATTQTLLGLALRGTGDETGATAAFAAATKLFDRIGARLDSELVEDSPGFHLPDGLTEREVEVLRLAAGGLTNNEIAGQLFLSPKTVSRHLSNIFTKIGVTSRAAATSYAFEHALIDRSG